MSQTAVITAMLGNRIDEWQVACHERDQAIINLRHELAQAKDQIKVDAMKTAGLEAQRNHLERLGKSAHEAFQLSGQFFKKAKDPKTGLPVAKTKLRIVYEVAFDAKGRELGITNPVERRQD